jgi:hypothetical protein
VFFEFLNRGFLDENVANKENSRLMSEIEFIKVHSTELTCRK